MEFENDTSWVRGMLYPGENLLWTGKPGKGHFFRKEDAVHFLPLLLTGGFAVFWFYGASRSGMSKFGILWGCLVLLLSLYFSVGRLIIKRFKEKKNRYALTSQRIIIKTGQISKSLDLNYLPRMTVLRFADGSGDIRFGESEPAFSRRGYGYERDYVRAVAELCNIPDVNNVEYRIRTAVEQALRARQTAQSE